MKHINLPTDGIPQKFLKPAQKLIEQKEITEQEFIHLCQIAVSLIESNEVTLEGRSDLALYIGNLWFKHQNIYDVELLGEIGGTFAELDRRGFFYIKGEHYHKRWVELKDLIRQAEIKMNNHDK